jgi:hypothetical protein
MNAIRSLLAVVLTLALLSACTTDEGIGVPSVELPSFDPDQIAQQLQDAVDQIGDAIPSIPADVLERMQSFDIEALPIPANAAEICGMMGEPNPAALAAGGLVAILSALAGDPTIPIGVLVSVIFSTCDSWAPFVDGALEDFFSNP